jgi:molecular chaperone DnaJ
VQVVVPQRLSGAAREAVQAFGIATSGEDVRAGLLDSARK